MARPPWSPSGLVPRGNGTPWVPTSISLLRRARGVTVQAVPSPFLRQGAAVRLLLAFAISSSPPLPRAALLPQRHPGEPLVPLPLSLALCYPAIARSSFPGELVSVSTERAAPVFCPSERTTPVPVPATSASHPSARDPAPRCVPWASASALNRPPSSRRGRRPPSLTDRKRAAPVSFFRNEHIQQFAFSSMRCSRSTNNNV